MNFPVETLPYDYLTVFEACYLLNNYDCYLDADRQEVVFK